MEDNQETDLCAVGSETASFRTEVKANKENHGLCNYFLRHAQKCARCLR